MITMPRNNAIIHAAILLTLLLLLSACAEKTTVVLLPDPNGKVGHVTVSNDAGSTDITEAREATTVSGRTSQPSAPKILSQKTIETEFSPVLKMLPSQPAHFILYFQGGSTDLTPASLQTVPAILQSIVSRKSEHISVIGHADTAGDRQYNLQLSRQRAAAVRRLLIDNGIASTFIVSTSHGEENPLIKTADNVHEPRNRRVEVVVK